VSQEHADRDSGPGLSQRLANTQDLPPHRAFWLPNRGGGGQNPDPESHRHHHAQRIAYGHPHGQFIADGHSFAQPIANRHSFGLRGPFASAPSPLGAI
jgi:hypothetical protein